MTAQQELWLRQICDAMCVYEARHSLRIHYFMKVHGFARQIGLHEGLSDDRQFILEAAALTHDIGIKPAMAQTGSCPGPLQERLGPPVATPMLKQLGLPEAAVERICFLIGHHHTTIGVDGPDWQILLEADELVNMIESHHTPQQIDSYRTHVFRTQEGLRLLDCLIPAEMDT